MYQIIERDFYFEYDELKEKAFEQIWIDEEFWENRDKGQHIVYSVDDLKFIVTTFIDCGYSQPSIRNRQDGINIYAYALYDTDKDEFLYITNCIKEMTYIRNLLLN